MQLLTEGTEEFHTPFAFMLFCAGHLEPQWAKNTLGVITDKLKASELSADQLVQLLTKGSKAFPPFLLLLGFVKQKQEWAESLLGVIATKLEREVNNLNIDQLMQLLTRGPEEVVTPFAHLLCLASQEQQWAKKILGIIAPKLEVSELTADQLMQLLTKGSPSQETPFHELLLFAGKQQQWAENLLGIIAAKLAAATLTSDQLILLYTKDSGTLSTPFCQLLVGLSAKHQYAMDMASILRRGAQKMTISTDIFVCFWYLFRRDYFLNLDLTGVDFSHEKVAEIIGMEDLQFNNVKLTYP